MSIIGQPYEDDLDDYLWRHADLMVEVAQLKRERRDLREDRDYYQDQASRIRRERVSA